MSVEQIIDYSTIAPKVEQALRKLVGENAVIEIEPGYQGRIRVKVVSRRLNGMTETEKQMTLWDVLRTEMNEEAQAVSFVIGYGTDEL